MADPHTNVPWTQTWSIAKKEVAHFGAYTVPIAFKYAEFNDNGAVGRWWWQSIRWPTTNKCCTWEAALQRWNELEVGMEGPKRRWNMDQTQFPVINQCRSCPTPQASGSKGSSNSIQTLNIHCRRSPWCLDDVRCVTASNGIYIRAWEREKFP